MVFIVDEGTLTKSQTGDIVSLFYLTYAPLQVVGGFVVDKWKPERFMILGLVGAAVANLLIYFHQGYAFMMTVWALNGMIQFGVYPAFFKIVANMSADHLQERFLVISGFANPVGTLCSYLVAAAVPHWRYSFLVSAVGLVVVALVFWGVFRGCRDDLAERELPAMARSAEKGSDGFLKMMLVSGVCLLLIFTLIRASLENGFRSLTPTMIKESYDTVNPTVATLLNTIILVAGAMGTLFANFLRRYLFKNEIKAGLALLLCCLPLVGLTLFVGRVHYMLLVVALALFVMLSVATTFFCLTLVAARFSKWGKSGTLAGIFNALAAVGYAVSNAVFTRVVERTSWQGTAVVWVGFSLVALVLLIITLPMWTRFCKKEFS